MANYPKWVPDSILERLHQYEVVQDSGDIWPTFAQEFDIWRRISTRPEMEEIWRFIVDRVDADTLTTNMGIIGTLTRAIRNFHNAPRFSPTDYKVEMKEIAKLAETLSNKLKKYCFAGAYNPFPYNCMLSREQLDESHKRMTRSHREPMERNNFPFWLDWSLPTLDSQIKELAEKARSESDHQASRLGLPRKVKDENLFRTYFIKKVGEYFFSMYGDYSPTRLATFCSCALDDADITPTLVRKLYELDNEMRAMLNDNFYIPDEEH